MRFCKYFLTATSIFLVLAIQAAGEDRPPILLVENPPQNHIVDVVGNQQAADDECYCCFSRPCYSCSKKERIEFYKNLGIFTLAALYMTAFIKLSLESSQCSDRDPREESYFGSIIQALALVGIFCQLTYGLLSSMKSNAKTCRIC